MITRYRASDHVCDSLIKMNIQGPQSTLKSGEAEDSKTWDQMREVYGVGVVKISKKWGSCSSPCLIYTVNLPFWFSIIHSADSSNVFSPLLISLRFKLSKCIGKEDGVLGPTRGCKAHHFHPFLYSHSTIFFILVLPLYYCQLYINLSPQVPQLSGIPVHPAHRVYSCRLKA